MRTYAMVLTVWVAEIVTMFILWQFTSMEILTACFWSIMAAIVALFAFGYITEPKRKKTAKWEQVGHLNVMVQGKRK